MTSSSTRNDNFSSFIGIYRLSTFQLVREFGKALLLTALLSLGVIPIVLISVFRILVGTTVGNEGVMFGVPAMSAVILGWRLALKIVVEVHIEKNNISVLRFGRKLISINLDEIVGARILNVGGELWIDSVKDGHFKSTPIGIWFPKKSELLRILEARGIAPITFPGATE